MSSTLEKADIADLLREMHRRGYECYPDDLLITKEHSVAFIDDQKGDPTKIHNDRTFILLNQLYAMASNFTDVSVVDDVTLQDGKITAIKIYSGVIKFLASPDIPERELH